MKYWIFTYIYIIIYIYKYMHTYMYIYIYISNIDSSYLETGASTIPTRLGPPKTRLAPQSSRHWNSAFAPQFWLVIWMGFETSTESPNFGNVCHDTEQTSTGNNLVIRVELKIDSPVRRELSSFPPQTCEAKELEIEVPTYGPKDFPRTNNEKNCVSIGA
jgi:hypothetical protein